MGFSSVPNFHCKYPQHQSLNRSADQYCLIRLRFNLLERVYIKKMKMARGVDYFKYFFFQGGHYSREAINRGAAIIQANTVYNFLS